MCGQTGRDFGRLAGESAACDRHQVATGPSERFAQVAAKRADMLKLGIIGLGQWGRHLVQSVQDKSEKLRFVAGYTTAPDGAAEFAKRHGLHLTADYADILTDPKLSGVVIATPHSLHLRHIVEAAKSRKHVFVEKPLALSRMDAEHAWRVCLEAKVGLFVGYNWRFQPALIALQALVGSGKLGEICHVEGNYSGPSAFRRSPGSWRNSSSGEPRRRNDRPWHPRAQCYEPALRSGHVRLCVQ